MTNKFIRSCVIATLLLLCATQMVLAASVAQIASDGLNLHWDVALLSFAICTLSGIASLLQRVSKELKVTAGALPNPWLFCSTNLAGSWVAGALAFATAQATHLEVWSELAAMIVASYAGAQYLEAQFEKRFGGSASVERGAA